MQVSQEIKDKLSVVLGNLIVRCIEDARTVPYVLDQDEAVDILVRTPHLFMKLVREEHSGRAELAREKLTARLDAISELGQFEALDAYDMSFYGPMESDADLSPVMNRIIHLTRTFVVYVSNTVTVFEKEFDSFVHKLRQSLQLAGMTPKAVEFAPSDMAGLEMRAEDYVTSGRFLQAFLFGRLLGSEAITRQVIDLPFSNYSFNENLIRIAARDPARLRDLVRFVLRACYVSQGSWEDLFAVLARLARQEPDLCDPDMLVETIERDAVFSCNFLREPFTALKQRSPEDRRTALREAMERSGGTVG